MGAAYQRGFSEALQNYVDAYNKKNPDKQLTAFEIEFVVDWAAFQGESLTEDKNATNTYYMRSKNDMVAGYEGAQVGKGDPKSKAIEIGVDKQGNPKSKGHHASSYPARDLPQSKRNGSGSSSIER